MLCLVFVITAGFEMLAPNEATGALTHELCQGVDESAAVHGVLGQASIDRPDEVAGSTDDNPGACAVCVEVRGRGEVGQCGWDVAVLAGHWVEV